MIRYGTDRVVALVDSSIAGRNVSEWLPGHDIPAVATLGEALAMPEPPDTLLIGSVTLGLIHGATPQAMVMVHKPGLVEHDFDHLPEAPFPIARLPEFIRLHESVAGLVASSKVVAVALNTSLYEDEAEARRVIAAIEAETGLPADDPVRFGGGPLWAAVRAGVLALAPVR
ncbi:MAG TPA: DUF1611 domain-containing protein [Candidatus Limnocylindrales bacterium]|nr:DUF1611 domain-containing protein [Candidatus Limnocylindrales bacterium]